MADAAKQAAWSAQGGQGDAPEGWNGEGGSKENPTYGSNGSAFKFPDIKLSDVGGSAADFSTTLNQKDDAAFGDYFKKAASQVTPLQAYDQWSNAAGLPAMRKTALNLQGQVDALDESIRRVSSSVDQRSNNSLVTQGQRDRMISAERAPMVDQLDPLSKSLATLTGNINQAESLINNRVGYLTASNAQELDPYKMRMNQVSEQNARAMTGFTADREVKLTTLLAKLASNERVSMAEMQEAAALSREQRQYQQQKELMDKSFQQELDKIRFNTDENIRQSKATKSGGGSSSDQAFAQILGMLGLGGTESAQPLTNPQRDYTVSDPNDEVFNYSGNDVQYGLPSYFKELS